MVEMSAGIAADLSEALATDTATTPTQARPSPRPSLGPRKDTILSIVELLLQQEGNRGKGVYLWHPVFNDC